MQGCDRHLLARFVDDSVMQRQEQTFAERLQHVWQCLQRATQLRDHIQQQKSVEAQFGEQRAARLPAGDVSPSASLCFDDHSFSGLSTGIAECTKDLLSTLSTTATGLQETAISLINDCLVGWLGKQKLCSIGPRFLIGKTYEQLELIEPLFADCQRLFVALLDVIVGWSNTLNAHCQQDASTLTHLSSLYEAVREKRKQFVWHSVIVAVQPPAYMLRVDRCVRHGPSSELRLLGAAGIGLQDFLAEDDITANFEKKKKDDACLIISEEDARTLRESSYLDTCVAQDFLMHSKSPALADVMSNFKVTGRYSIKFEGMCVTAGKGRAQSQTEGQSQRRRDVDQMRYYVAYKVELSGCHNLCLTGYNLSLPLVAVVNTNLKADASIWWDRCFSEHTGVLDDKLPAEVLWADAAVALDYKFMALIESPASVTTKTSRHTPPPENLSHPRGLTAANLHQIAKILSIGNTHNGYLAKSQFFATYIALNASSGARLFFYEWFYKCAEMIKKYMLQPWNNGLVYGFAQKGAAEDLVSSAVSTTRRPTMLIRFSEKLFGHVKLTYCFPGKTPRHFQALARELGNRSLAEELRVSPSAEIQAIECIYPDQPKANLLAFVEPQSPPSADRQDDLIDEGYWDNVDGLAHYLITQPQQQAACCCRCGCPQSPTSSTQ